MTIHTITITTNDETCLFNDLLDIQEWIEGMVSGKINNCRKRMITEWLPRLMADPNITSIPATDEGILDLIVNHPEYKNRVQRETDTVIDIGLPV